VFSAVEQLSSVLVEAGAVDPAYMQALLHRESLCSNAIQSGALFQFALTPAVQSRLCVAVLKHRMTWKNCRIRMILTACFRPQDRPWIFRIKSAISRMNRLEDIGSLRTVKELEAKLRTYL
jgi:mannitol/fructose-specific phosphotransferase system IIA component